MVPALGESVTEATVSTWFKSPGDAVEADEMLCELETDKIERLEKECLRIRERLGLPTHLGPFAILQEYTRLYREPNEQCSGGWPDRGIANSLLSDKWWPQSMQSKH